MATAPDKQSDASLPGSGARRVVALLQLYVRIMAFPAVTVTVVDALCGVFTPGGATVGELASYLGLPEDTVRAGLANLPREICCTIKGDHPDALPDGADGAGDAALAAAGGRHTFDLRRAVPFIYAHVSRMLLALCSTAIPAAGEDTAAAPGSGPSVTRALRDSEATRGVCCPSCLRYAAPREYRLSRCAQCDCDVLQWMLTGLQAVYVARLAAGKSLVVAGSSGSSGARPQQQQQGDGEKDRGDGHADGLTGAGLGKEEMARLNCPLSRDPFLVQQALAFRYLYSVPFACAGQRARVCDPDEMLTGPEYERRRAQGTASTSDRFRARHRNPASVHVTLAVGAERERRLREENRRKIENRTRLPPWLRHTTTLAALHDPDAAAGADDDTRRALDAVLGKTAHPTEQTDRKRPRPAESGGENMETSAESLTAAATFITKTFLEDEFEVVFP